MDLPQVLTKAFLDGLWQRRVVRVSLSIGTGTFLKNGLDATTIGNDSRVFNVLAVYLEEDQKFLAFRENKAMEGGKRIF